MACRPEAGSMTLEVTEQARERLFTIWLRIRKRILPLNKVEKP